MNRKPMVAYDRVEARHGGGRLRVQEAIPRRLMMDGFGLVYGLMMLARCFL